MMRVRRTNGGQMYLERLLHEYPWLWAIQPRWDSILDDIEIKTVSLNVLKQTANELNFPSVWVKVRRPYGGTWVLEANTQSRHRNLAGYSLQQAQRVAEKDEVESVALIRKRMLIGTNLSTYVTIYTERKPGDFHRLCLEAINGLPEIMPLSSDVLLMMADGD